MRILLVHQNFPGQFAPLVAEWATRSGWDVRGLGQIHAPGLSAFSGLMRYRPARAIRRDQHPYLRNTETAVLNGQAAARIFLQLKDKGFKPDVIVAHPGWGETLYAKDVFPEAQLIHLCEWYYNAQGADLGFDQEFPLTFNDRARIRTWNAHHALSLVDCDTAVSPTLWQKSRYPKDLRQKILVQHEGIDTNLYRPDPMAWVKTKNGTMLKSGDPVITYVARNLEPYRGFHVFMRALETIQRLHRTCHTLIVGGDEVSYGRKPENAKNWRERMLNEVTLDPSRTHFVGRLPKALYRRVLQVSGAHVYLTYPFVLSWSLLEAMSCNAPIVASDTAPVREVIKNGVNGRLVDFFDTEVLATTVVETLVESRARRLQSDSINRFSYEDGIAGYEKILKIPSQVNSGDRSP
ncbi:glycosyltransferase family 4 protein [uncultured Pseudacidovorax sp.]|uniref:glycosyltransferase family 4 protein n=1 Tax=uncultured Pseudacidovorax sp. TaxID=679313 RepID=UPI0025F0CC82|nr:glycosyltransferase family 4 protein [uncultured Pseudacidovorax sp.]